MGQSAAHDDAEHNDPRRAFAERLARYAADIEQYLSVLLDEETRKTAQSDIVGADPGHGADTGNGVPDRLPDRLIEGMRHAVLGGGKRFRPFLVLASADVFKVPPATALPAAAAVEIIHCYSLAHDDLPAMDNDDLRRGRPTVWRAFDEWTAILAGDALQALAFDILSASATRETAWITTQLISLLARSSGGPGMVGGQMRDLQAERIAGGEAALGLREIRSLQSMKTGALITFSCEAGAVLAGLDDSHPERIALRRFGDHLGYAFQIADDLLDVEGDVAEVGKAVAKDADAGKATLVSLMGVAQARAELQRTRDAALAELACFGPRADPLRGAAHFVVDRRS
ncbi:MAG: polyprenyl synthetase family protein [Pseudomonadota bacterium]